jgi:hypothetical protein
LFIGGVAPLTLYRGIAPLNPLYAFFLPAEPARALVPLAASGIAFAAIAPLARAGLPLQLAGSFLLMVAIRACFAFARHDFDAMGVEFLVYPREEILFDVSRVERIGLGPFLARYPELMPSLSLHGRNYPPGFAALLYALTRALGSGVNAIGWSVVILASTVAAPIVLAARRMAGPAAGGVAGVLAAVFPASILFGAVSLSALFAALAAWPVLLLLAALDGARPRATALGCGVALGVCAFFSFAAFPLGYLCLLTALFAAPRAGPGAVARILAGVGLGFAACVAALEIGLGFDLFAALLAGHGGMVRSMGTVTEQTLGATRLYASFGNLTAFLLGLGFPLVGLLGAALVRGATRGTLALAGATLLAAAVLVASAVLESLGALAIATTRTWLAVVGALAAGLPLLGALAARRTGTGDEPATDTAGALGFALALTAVVIGTAGLYHMETERNWLFLAMLAVLPAAALLARTGEARQRLTNLRFVAALLLGQAVAQEIFLYTLW